MTKRKIFLILSVITGISNFLIPYLLVFKIMGPASITEPPLFILMTLYSSFVIVVALIFVIFGKSLKFFHWLDNLKKLKKVYHSQLGYFYIDCDFKKDEAILYEQTPFNLIEIYKIYSLDYLSEEIKEILDKRYKEKIDNETKMNKVKNWDGFLDIEGKRDQKIDQIIK
jgi:Cdc6-like AAA superfamily ATPase